MAVFSVNGEDFDSESFEAAVNSYIDSSDDDSGIFTVYSGEVQPPTAKQLFKVNVVETMDEAAYDLVGLHDHDNIFDISSKQAEDLQDLIVNTIDLYLKQHDIKPIVGMVVDVTTVNVLFEYDADGLLEYHEVADPVIVVNRDDRLVCDYQHYRIELEQPHVDGSYANWGYNAKEPGGDLPYDGGWLDGSSCDSPAIAFTRACQAMDLIIDEKWLAEFVGLSIKKMGEK